VNKQIAVFALGTDGLDYKGVHNIEDVIVASKKEDAIRTASTEPFNHPEFGDVFVVKADGYGYLDWCYSFESDANDQKYNIEHAFEALMRSVKWVESPENIPNIG
jgi:hypothetical protein